MSENLGKLHYFSTKQMVQLSEHHNRHINHILLLLAPLSPWGPLRTEDAEYQGMKRYQVGEKVLII